MQHNSVTASEKNRCLTGWYAGAGVALILLSIYVATICPTIYSGDAAELATAGATFGIPHPPGYPLYTLSANIFSRLLPFGEVAWRLNLLSSIAAAGAAFFLYALVIRLGASWISAAFAALSLGVGATFWSQAIITEVYAFDILLASATLFSAVCARQQGTLPGCVAVMMCIGFWTGHRNVNLLYIPAVVMIVWPVLKANTRSWTGTLIIAAALLTPFLILLYLPIASSCNPRLDTGDPETWRRFWEMVTARIYKQYLFVGPPGSFGKQFKVLLSGFPGELGTALVLAPMGAVLWWRKRRGDVLALSYLVIANITFAANYQVLDVTVFTLPAFLALFVFAGAGAEGLLRKFNSLFLTLILFAGVLAMALLNFQTNNLRGQTLCADFARHTLSHAERDAVILTNVDSVSYSLWYLQYVKKLRPDVLVVSKGRAVGWYQEQIQKLRSDLIIEPYEGINAASRWPAMLIERNLERAPIYLTANVAGYFAPTEAAELSALCMEVPAGLLIRLVPKTAAPALESVIRRNNAIWQQVWPDARKARKQKLNQDMTALLLHYASMRILFARYCLWYGQAQACARAAYDVQELKTAALITGLNKIFSRQGFRYHMSDMPARAARFLELSHALQSGKLTLLQIRQKLAPKPSAAKDLDQRNQAGISKAKQGNFKEALIIFETILQQAPNHLGARFNKAKVLAELGQTDEAVATYQEILQYSPSHVFALIGLADLKKVDNPQEARTLYRRAMRAAENSPLEALAAGKLEQIEKALGEPGS